MDRSVRAKGRRHRCSVVLLAYDGLSISQIGARLGIADRYVAEALDEQQRLERLRLLLCARPVSLVGIARTMGMEPYELVDMARHGRDVVGVDPFGDVPEGDPRLFQPVSGMPSGHQRAGRPPLQPKLRPTGVRMLRSGRTVREVADELGVDWGVVNGWSLQMDQEERGR